MYLVIFSLSPSTLPIISKTYSFFYFECWETTRKNGGFDIITSNYPEILADKTVNAAFYEFWKEKALPLIKDPGKRKFLMPDEQPVWFMARWLPVLGLLRTDGPRQRGACRPQNARQGARGLTWFSGAAAMAGRVRGEERQESLRTWDDFEPVKRAAKM
ncbi:hypothetical protein MY3296_003013 [Beauveria thailandica]